jgi:hypothetical protein
MTFPLSLPDWLPWWVPLAVLVPVLLYVAVFLMMPFSVFGLKGRLDLLDARLDEIQSEIRTLSLRLPDVTEAPPRRRDAAARPPIPPAAPSPSDLPRRPLAPRDSAEDWEDEPREAPRRGRGPGERSEPRLGWPR